MLETLFCALDKRSHILLVNMLIAFRPELYKITDHNSNSDIQHHELFHNADYGPPHQLLFIQL